MEQREQREQRNKRVLELRHNNGNIGCKYYYFILIRESVGRSVPFVPPITFLIKSASYKNRIETDTKTSYNGSVRIQAKRPGSFFNALPGHELPFPRQPL